jgi:hypothetical protein
MYWYTYDVSLDSDLSCIESGLQQAAAFGMQFLLALLTKRLHMECSSTFMWAYI